MHQLRQRIDPDAPIDAPARDLFENVRVPGLPREAEVSAPLVRAILHDGKVPALWHGAPGATLKAGQGRLVPQDPAAPDPIHPRCKALPLRLLPAAVLRPPAPRCTRYASLIVRVVH